VFFGIFFKKTLFFSEVRNKMIYTLSFSFRKAQKISPENRAEASRGDLIYYQIPINILS
jgi:hypothetical protein